METNQQESVTQTDVSSATTEKKQETVVNQDHDRYKRDMFKYKDQVKELSEQLKQYELHEQQKKGNFEGVIGKLKDEIKELKHTNAKKDLSFANTQINNAIRNEALKRGIKDVDVLMKLVDKSDKDLIELDESYNPSSDDVKNLMDKNMERYGHIFKKSVNIVDATPNNRPQTRPEKKFDLDKMSGDEIFAALKAGKMK